VARDEKITHLERVPLFEDCSLRQLRAVADISTVVEVPERTVLTRAGEPGDEFFVIIDGTALVTLSPQKRHRMQPGAFFGEMSLLDGEPRSATVKAETDLRLLVIDRTHFWRLLKEVPGPTEKILVIATVASLLADLIWYYLGRQRGSRVLALLCRLSLEPDSCVRRTENLFARHGTRSLLIAKFVPGLSTVAPPLAGIFGVGVARFVLYGGAG